MGKIPIPTSRTTVSTKKTDIKAVKVASCVPPAYFASHSKQLAMEEFIEYDGNLKSTARLDLYMTPHGNCPSVYTPILRIHVHNQKRNIWGNWKDDARTVYFSHGYSKNYPEIMTHTNQTYPEFHSQWGFPLNESMSTTGTAIHVYYHQAFSNINTNDYLDIFRLQNYWAHIAVSGGSKGAVIDFGQFM
jgi:hypothetical protein